MPSPPPDQQGAVAGLHAGHGVAGLIIASLIVYVGLHLLGFRFVGSASLGVGR